jgi:hypothetical protein
MTDQLTDDDIREMTLPIIDALAAVDDAEGTSHRPVLMAVLYALVQNRRDLQAALQVPNA